MSIPCYHGRASRCFRPDRCVRSHRVRMVHILWRELLPGVFDQIVADKFSISEVYCFQSWNLSAARFQCQLVTKRKRRTISRSPRGQWIRFVQLQWECGYRRNLAVNQLVHNQFLGLCFQAVHVLHPLHLMLLLVRSRVLFQQFLHGLLHPALCGLLHFQ